MSIGPSPVYADKLAELGFGHLLEQPHYVGRLALAAVNDSLIRTCVEEGILTRPDPHVPTFGCYAWHQAPRLMTSWSVGR